MQFTVDDGFAAEATRFDLRCACEHCIYFDPATETCTHGYPNAPHRAATLLRVHASHAGVDSSLHVDAPAGGASGRGVVLAAFCKEFELR